MRIVSCDTCLARKLGPKEDKMPDELGHMTGEEFADYVLKLSDRYASVSTQEPTPAHLAEITSRLMCLDDHPFKVIILAELVRTAWMDGYGVGRNATANGLRLDLPEKGMEWHDLPA